MTAVSLWLWYHSDTSVYNEVQYGRHIPFKDLTLIGLCLKSDRIGCKDYKTFGGWKIIWTDKTWPCNYIATISSTSKAMLSQATDSHGRRWANADLMLAPCLPRGSTLNQHWFNVLCLLAGDRHIWQDTLVSCIIMYNTLYWQQYKSEAYNL